MAGKNIVQEYASSATVHGISKFGKSRLRRIIWIALVIICTIALSVFLVAQFIEFSKHPVSTRFSVDMVEQLEFPAITVCNLNQVKMSIRDCVPGYDLTRYFYETSEVALLTPGLIFNESAKTNVTPPSGKQLIECYKNHSQTLEELFVFCYWQNEQKNCGKIFETRITEYGRCFTFNGNPDLESKVSVSQGPFSGLHLVINLRTDLHYFAKTMQTGIKVIVHNRKEEPLPEWRGFLVSPGTSTDAIIYQTQKQYIGQPHGSCVEKNANPLKRYRYYSKNACIRECYTDYVTAQCGCKSILDPGTEPFCGVKDMLRCYLKVSENLTIGDLPYGNCQKPCEETIFETHTSHAAFGSAFMDQFLYEHGALPDSDILKRSFIQLRIFYDDMIVSSVEEVPEITLESIFASVGGYMGLFLGASILSVVELVELVILLITDVNSKKVNSKDRKDIGHKNSLKTLDAEQMPRATY